MSTGIYISVPFCRSKCSYCNFASGVFPPAMHERYVARVCSEIERAAEAAERVGAKLDREVDSIYLGGGTPTLLDIEQLRGMFVTISQNFDVQQRAEITVECAPGTLSAGMVEGLAAAGVNRVSLGVQSFVDREAAAVGRLHTQQTVVDELVRLHNAGIRNINIDLIAGLPHQTVASWDISLQQALDSGAPHVSVYMLEVDEDSRLGRELIAGGTRYHAHHAPDDDLTVDLYLEACERLSAAGIPQYEISNFAQPGAESRHNLKYWTRKPYVGFGVDAHSMLLSSVKGNECVRMATPDSLTSYLAAEPSSANAVSDAVALEEAFFLGLRLNRGVDLEALRRQFGEQALRPYPALIAELVGEGLLESSGENLRFTQRGRLVSNEVFERFIGEPAVTA